LVQRITLCSQRAAVTFHASFLKEDLHSPEGVYFAFPFHLPEWRAHFDPANVPAEFDAEQLPGSCRDYTMVGQWVALHNAKQSLTLACPDSPLVQIGGFHFGKVQQDVERNSEA